jgi:hypothetical protein
MKHSTVGYFVRSIKMNGIEMNGIEMNGMEMNYE